MTARLTRGVVTNADIPKLELYAAILERSGQEPEALARLRDTLARREETESYYELQGWTERMADAYLQQIQEKWDEITGMYLAFEEKKPIIEFDVTRHLIVA